MSKNLLTKALLLLVGGALTFNLLGRPKESYGEQPKQQVQEQQQKSELDLIIEKAISESIQTPELALATCEQALAQYPQSPELYFLMGYIFDQNGFSKEAQELYGGAFGLVGDRFQDRMTAEDIYKNGIKADCVYPGGRVSSSNILIIPKEGISFLKTKMGEWTHYYFDAGKTSSQLQQILKEDPKINFEEFDIFMDKYREEIKGCSIHPEGYMLFGLRNFYLLIEISPETKDKIYKL